MKNRTFLDRVLYPTPTDIILIRIFFWISILICLLLPKYNPAFGTSQTWRIIFGVWIAAAVTLRLFVYVRANKMNDER